MMMAIFHPATTAYHRASSPATDLADTDRYSISCRRVKPSRSDTDATRNPNEGSPGSRQKNSIQPSSASGSPIVDISQSTTATIVAGDDGANITLSSL